MSVVSGESLRYLYGDLKQRHLLVVTVVVVLKPTLWNEGYFIIRKEISSKVNSSYITTVTVPRAFGLSEWRS